MDHISAFTSDCHYATAALQRREQSDLEGVMAPQYSSRDIHRRPTGFIDYDFYREAAKRERERAKIAFVRKLLGMFATLSRRVGDGLRVCRDYQHKTRIGLNV
jgi:hypothetical protein